jgi:hypothetical protein
LKRRLILVILALACASAGTQGFRPDSTAIAEVQGLPSIGKWMIGPDLAPAHWLGESWRSRQLREPINMIIIDPHSASPDEARANFLKAATESGFPSRSGHSGGYWAWIGQQLQPQFPETPAHAFSDAPFELDNNHGRLFGPYRHAGRYIFVGAVSREKVAPLSTPKHQYVSFNRGRDKFADALDAHSGFCRTGFVDLGNALVDHPDLTTGDHDGMAAVLTLRKP